MYDILKARRHWRWIKLSSLVWTTPIQTKWAVPSRLLLYYSLVYFCQNSMPFVTREPLVAKLEQKITRIYIIMLRKTKKTILFCLVLGLGWRKDSKIDKHLNTTNTVFFSRAGKWACESWIFRIVACYYTVQSTDTNSCS